MGKKKEKIGRVIAKIQGPPLQEIEAKERETDHFAKGLCFYKLFWIFFIGAFLGVVVELLFCLATQFHLENRSGLIYGPFNPVYGFGAVALTLGLYWLRYKRDLYILIGGTILGGAIEYICSWVQEQIFGTVSWDYSKLPFNINGRICLLYSIFWGILAILWIKFLYPRFCSLILKIPNKLGRPLSWILAVFMVFNMFMSSVAVLRWAERLEDIPATTSIGRYMDKHYPNSRMEWYYPNMRFMENGKISEDKSNNKGVDPTTGQAVK